MTALIFEIIGAINLIVATYFWATDRNDIVDWLFFLLCSVIMYLNAARYEENG